MWTKRTHYAIIILFCKVFTICFLYNMFYKNMYIYILSYTYAFYIYYFKEVFSYMIDSSTNLANTSSNKPHNYHEQSQIDQTLRLREVLKTLPPFAKDYFRAMEPNHLHVPALTMLTISVYFSISLWKIILCIRIIRWTVLCPGIWRTLNL